VRRNRVAAATILAAALAAAPVVAACGHEGSSTSPSASSSTQAVASVEPPDPQLANDPVVAAVKASVVDIAGVSPNCTNGGSGFVVAPNRVMTPAASVRGSQTFTVKSGGKTFDAHVVSYDPARNLAILDVPGLPAAPMPFAETTAKSGTDAILLGYPEGGDVTAVPARIREVIELNGPDLDQTTTVSREVYTVRGNAKDVRGGPLIDRQGRVLGIAFGQATDDPDTSFALTAKEIGRQMGELGNTVPVATGRENC
jgi:S1-C subfamily serine protease